MTKKLVCVSVCLCACMSLCMDVNTCVNAHPYIQLFVYVSGGVHACILTHLCTCRCARVCACMSVLPKYIPTYTCMHAHIDCSASLPHSAQDASEVTLAFISFPITHSCRGSAAHHYREGTPTSLLLLCDVVHHLQTRVALSRCFIALDLCCLRRSLTIPSPSLGAQEHLSENQPFLDILWVTRDTYR